MSPPARVLLIDRDQDSLEMYLTFLRSIGFEAIAAADGHGATELAATAQAAVVVTAVDLHGAIDGLEVTRRLRLDDRTALIPVIVLTGPGDHGRRARSEGVGCNLFLTKPCAPAALASEIRSLIAKSMVDPQRTAPSNAGLTDRRKAKRGQKP
jgi:CheY-like chemotaxis protein